MTKPNLQPIVFSSPEEIISFLDNKKRYVTLIDPVVARHFGSYFPSPFITVELAEKDKIFKEVERVASLLLEMEADRETTLVIAGGGVLSDLGAFTASVYMRGIPFILVPTTLLAMVDASIGGKNGVNLGVHKNILGSFSNARQIIISPQFLATLPQVEYLNGVAELLKTFIIADRESYFKVLPIVNNVKSIAPYIRRAASIKASIVERDWLDKGERRLLNLGHTFAHAMELAENISHGLAVAKGIVLAAKLSVKLSLLCREEYQAVEEGLKSAGLDISVPVPVESLTNIICSDKKRNGDIINFVLIKRVGETVVHPIHISDLKDILHDLS